MNQQHWKEAGHDEENKEVNLVECGARGSRQSVNLAGAFLHGHNREDV